MGVLGRGLDWARIDEIVETCSYKSSETGLNSSWEGGFSLFSLLLSKPLCTEIPCLRAIHYTQVEIPSVSVLP